MNDGPESSPPHRPHDIPLLFVARALRGFGDGFATIILPAYLSAIGFAPGEVGVIASASLLGTALFTLGVGFIAPRHDLRTLLLAGAALMACTGLAFPAFQTIAAIAIVAFVGTINPSTGDLGVLIPLEHAMLAHAVPDQKRTHIFARYSLIGALSMAAGSLAAAAPDFLVRTGIDTIAAFKFMFAVYALLGFGCFLLYRRLPHARMGAARPSAPLGPSRGVVYKLAALFSLDSFAGGLVVQSLLALWLFRRFNLSIAAAGSFFFVAGLLGAASQLASSWIADRFGRINTMVFTHIPASVFMMLAALMPTLQLTLLFLLLRFALSSMDVPARQSFVMAVVPPEERAAAASVTNVPRSLATALAPLPAGALLDYSLFGWPLVCAGVLKITYDVLLLAQFRAVKPEDELD